MHNKPDTSHVKDFSFNPALMQKQEVMKTDSPEFRKRLGECTNEALRVPEKAASLLLAGGDALTLEQRTQLVALTLKAKGSSGAYLILSLDEEKGFLTGNQKIQLADKIIEEAEKNKEKRKQQD